VLYSPIQTIITIFSLLTHHRPPPLSAPSRCTFLLIAGGRVRRNNALDLERPQPLVLAPHALLVVDGEPRDVERHGHDHESWRDVSTAELESREQERRAVGARTDEAEHDADFVAG